MRKRRIPERCPSCGSYVDSLQSGYTKEPADTYWAKKHNDREWLNPCGCRVTKEMAPVA